MKYLDECKKRRIARWVAEGGAIPQVVFKDLEKKVREVDIEIGERVAKGTYTEIYKPKEIETMYCRKNLCLKIFIDGTENWGKDYILGYSNILESTMVQNYMADQGKAPYVYDIVKINGKYAQITEYIEGENKEGKIEDDRFIFHKTEITQPHNLINGKLVDFQGAKFKDFGSLKREILYKATARINSNGASGGAYQSTQYFGGFRNTEERLKKYNFNEFKGKTVLDIGCNYGMFAREAIKQGAKRVVGIDTPEVINIARQLAITDGYFNIDYIGADIKTLTQKEITKMTGIEKFDIHLFLSMIHWVGMPDWLKNCDTLYTEGHGKERVFKRWDIKNNPNIEIKI
jgi:SAM-dependent methyltransferase